MKHKLTTADVARLVNCRQTHIGALLSRRVIGIRSETTKLRSDNRLWEPDEVVAFAIYLALRAVTVSASDTWRVAQRMGRTLIQLPDETITRGVFFLVVTDPNGGTETFRAEGEQELALTVAENLRRGRAITVLPASDVIMRLELRWRELQADGAATKPMETVHAGV